MKRVSGLRWNAEKPRERGYGKSDRELEFSHRSAGRGPFLQDLNLDRITPGLSARKKGTATVLRSGVLATRFQRKTPDLNTFAPSPSDIQGTRPTGTLSAIPRIVRGREPVPFFRPRTQTRRNVLREGLRPPIARIQSALRRDNPAKGRAVRSPSRKTYPAPAWRDGQQSV